VSCSDAPSGLRWLASTSFSTGTGDDAFAPAEPIATATDGKSILLVVNNQAAWDCATCAQWKAALYDVASDRWTPLPDLEVGSRGFLRNVVQAAATPRGWIVWTAGEGVDSSHLKPGAAEFVTATGSWTLIAPPETEFYGAAFTWSPATRSLWALDLATDTSTWENHVQAFERADDGTWVARARKPPKYDWPPPELIWLGDRLFVGDATYDAKTDSWSDISTKPPLERSGRALAVPECDSIAYVSETNGAQFLGLPAGAYWVPAAEQWRAIPDKLPTTHRDGLGVVNGKLVVWSNYTIPAHGPANFLPIHGVFDFATATWTIREDVEHVRTVGRPVAIGCDLYYLSVDADHSFRLFAYRP
jgi:hypothetical protein